MSKIKVLVIVVILFFVGVFSVTFSFGDFFFTTKYYKTALEAYNADCAFSPGYGDTEAESTIGFAKLDEGIGLFIGELDEHSFVINEMVLKDGKYASNGTSLIYDLREESDGQSKNQTVTSSKTINWAVLYSQAEIDVLSDIESVEIYTHSSGNNIYFAIYKEK